jgi:7-cyano-7-deazaguanine synthase in queuosine biosynthesis
MTRIGRRSFQIPAARIVVCHKPALIGQPGIRCVIGRDLVIKPEALGRYCLKSLEPRIYDLVLIAGAVAFADRAVPRRTSICWRRELEVVIPTSEPEFWKQARLTKSLTDTLELLTGDVWCFHFTPTKRRPQVAPQAPLALGGGSAVVIPFSDGLDSFAAALLASARVPNLTLIRVTTGERQDTRNGKQQYRVSIPFSPRDHHIRLRETSYRSRGFVFGVMAGVAAHLLEAERIIVPESGQGALGPWLNPVGSEAPDVRMHPFFTANLSRFLRIVFDQHILHEHPQLWKTKGETLRELKDLGLDKGWWGTKSCPRARKVCMNNKRVQCGVCASCLLRRQSLLAAGLDEGEDKYFWANLSAPSLRQAADASARNTGPNDERQAKCGLYDLNALGNLLATDSGNERISDASAELAIHEGTPREIVAGNLRRLLVAHREEWRTLIAAQKSESFPNKWLEILQC